MSNIQGVSPFMLYAQRIEKFKGAARAVPITEAEKARRKQVTQSRETRRREENLAQRALVQSKRP